MRDWMTNCFPAVALAIGIVMGGWFIGDGLIHARLGDRFVTVKGLAERIVKADLVVWPIRFIATGNDLSQVQNQITTNADMIREFMDTAGIPPEEITIHGLEVTDLYAEAYHQGPIENRFIIAQTLVIRSENVDQVASVSQRISKLVDSGVVLSDRAGPWGGGPLYLFTRLTELKPNMIAEATKDAHAAAEQFAMDSASQLGGIRKANQGLFQILPRDKTPNMQEEEQIYKTVRVVSTIEYFLRN